MECMPYEPPVTRTTLAPTIVGSAGSGPTTITFEAFFERHRVRLVQALWLIVRSQQEAEEVAQDAFLRVWERWPVVAAHPNPEGYLYRTALNLARSRRRRLILALRKTMGGRLEDDPLLRVEAQDVVIRALARLTPKQRATVVLVDLVGLTSVEASAVLGSSPSTIRVLLARGRETLRREWQIDD
jgi:RNA polymerase sigma-70 factor (ECF subfamily)